MKLIDLDRRNSVDSLIHTLKSNKSKVRVWQSIKESGEYSFGIIESIDTLNRTIRIKITEAGGSDIDKDQHIYFHSVSRDIIFKSQIKKAAGRSLEISIPMRIKLQEARTEKRTNLGIQSNHYVNVLFTKACKEKLRSKLRVLDVSTSGMALIVSKFIFEGFSVDDKVIVIGPTVNGEVEKKIFIIRNKGIIVNKIGASQEFRVGLELCG